MNSSPNQDSSSISSFGDEWLRFDQSQVPSAEASRIFEDYFFIFPWHHLPPDCEGFDMGCGSGRWARFVAPRVAQLHCIDPSRALDVARKNLASQPNVHFHQTSVSCSGLLPNSQDFGYSLGVLHHVPDTAAAIESCVKLLKPGAPFLMYIYYAFDNRPFWFRLLWQLSNHLRHSISSLPPHIKQLVTDLIALAVYLPLARFALIAEFFNLPFKSIPLSYYRRCSFYTMRTDSRDRFGTPLENRFTRTQIRDMCIEAGLINLRFSPNEPFWCVVGFKR